MTRSIGSRTIPTRVLVAGVSTRAAAESAARAGFAVTAVDAFADRDQHPEVTALSVRRDFDVPFSAHAAARAARGVRCDAVAYLSSFENHPHAVRLLSEGRALWGNTPAVLRKVRDPIRLMEALRQRGFAALEVRRGEGRTEAPRHNHEVDSADSDGSRSPTEAWLLKPLKSGGGHGVRPWSDVRASTGPRRSQGVPRGGYLQEFVQGVPGSLLFVAARGRAVPFGLSCQLVGDRAFGAAGFQYCGSVLVPAGDPRFPDDEEMTERLGTIADALADAFDLVGVNGIDFVARDAAPYVIEVNPRWSASMELVEREYGMSVFGVHAGACARGVLPDFHLAHARRGAQAFGKAVVFARQDVNVGDTSAWLADATVRDIPHQGERVRTGSPICTVFAAEADAATCHAALVERAARIYADLDEWAARNP